MDLKKLQEEVNARWALQLNNPCHASADANHAFVHLTKALGKIASAMNDAEHEKRPLRCEEVQKCLADLVLCAARFGEGLVNLDVACAERLVEKFPATGPGSVGLAGCGHVERPGVCGECAQSTAQGV